MNRSAQHTFRILAGTFAFEFNLVCDAIHFFCYQTTCANRVDVYGAPLQMNEPSLTGALALCIGFPIAVWEYGVCPYLSFVEELCIRHSVLEQECSGMEVGLRVSATNRLVQAMINIVGDVWWRDKLLPEMLNNRAAFAGSWPLEILMQRESAPEWKSNDMDLFVPIHPDSHDSTTLCWLSTDEVARLRRCKRGPSNFTTSLEDMFYQHPTSIYSTGEFHASVRYGPEWGEQTNGIAWVRNYWLRPHDPLVRNRLALMSSTNIPTRVSIDRRDRVFNVGRG